MRPRRGVAKPIGGRQGTVKEGALVKARFLVAVSELQIEVS